MSDDEADPEILALLREQLGIGKPAEQSISSDTGQSNAFIEAVNHAESTPFDRFAARHR